MSFEPDIIIEKKDLEKIEGELINLSCSNNEEEQEMANYLLVVLRYSPTEFKGMKIIIFKPEFSHFNEKVRKYLTKKRGGFCYMDIAEV